MSVIDFNQWGGDAPRAEIDYPTLARLALCHARAILETWMPGGKFIGREYLCATIKGGAGTSCSTNFTTGVGGDFATDQTWGDLIKLVTVVDGVPPHEAAARIAGFIGADLNKPLPPLPPIATPSPNEKYQAGRETARRLLDESDPCPVDFPYLVRKGAKPAEGVKFHEPTGNMLVPLRDENGALWSVQRIAADGTKKINDGGRLSGNFFQFPGTTSVVYLAEGYATAATVHELTGATTVMGITSGNLPAVAEALARKYPTATLIVAGDNDDAGRKAVAKVQEKAPRFKAVFPPKEGDDWNDLYVREGAEAVRAAIDAGMGTGAEKTGPEVIVFEEMETESARNLLSTLSPPVDEVVAGLIARREVLTCGGAPKGGKSYFALQGGLAVAGGSDFLGMSVPHPFKVLYVLAEGSKRRFKDRLAAATPYAPWIEDEDLDRLHVVDTRGRLKIDTEAGEKTLLRLAEPFDLIILDTLYALQGGGDENSHKDFRKVSGALDRLKHLGPDGKAVWLIHHVRKNSSEDAGADELRGAGFSAFSDAIVRLYKRKGRLGVHYELKFDLRNYEEREDLLLTRLGPLFAPMDASNSKVDLQNYVVATITERGGRVEGRENLVKILVALTKMKRQTCINAIGEAINSGRVSSATMPGTNAKVYFLTDGNDDEE